MEQEKQLTSLPENAYRELKPGEEYTPIMPASSSPREVTPYSVTMGIVMAVVFSAAAAFLGLKVGQVFEAAIPIAIIAVGMGNVLGKKNMLGQNVIIQSIGVPALAFALGMFIPMELNAPLVVGGLVAWFVSNRSKDEALNKARFDRGTLIASGFIAGGALMGVVSALLKFAEVDWFLSGWASSNAAEWTGLIMYLALIGYFGWHTLRAKKEE